MGRAFEYRKAAKEKRWGNMSRVFPKLAKAIEKAAKEGGGEPDMNPKLRTAILNAKSENMPKDNITAAIKRATGKDAKDMADVIFEGKGPHGSMFIIECLTDNNTRTVANVKNPVNKNSGEMLNKGALDFMFTRKAIFEFKLPEGGDVEELEMELIDAGLEELEEEAGECIVHTSYADFGNMNSKLEELKVEMTKATLQYLSNTPISVTDEQMEDIRIILDKLDEDEDVQAVYTNIQ
ncbi:YebC/PmpR family DNA-binding transcriptional regulator [Sulfurimonas sp. MAG313]|nr:YebC/PmpR family DNA-binding transcriptional regulator [Sulfurimonas sp. MAG313]MDF1881222.1 YebC/PmpR family DNA-binding transcriptional regulator [Sulfurimonas sp. MAG313]